ncbi:hypothetical protein BN971_02036 [Mycobacterium bohemicum DSM 44277]|uniref:Uncharacterized protein n=1 Tax=Mycobacterium bohemicum DSM 44277 TaxID=1236609 RepID=A0A0U0W9F4_MYCBE|nr:hypothetical protein BN971_02036 [Mycobacterium bohemicum DSM 44277]
MVSGSFTWGVRPSISRTSSGAASTDSAVATSSSVVVIVTRRRTNAAPPSGSPCSARASTGTKIAVNVASSTSAATRFGSWLATENALDSAAPRIAASTTMRAKPVSRLISVANAMAHDRETRAASDSSGRRRSTPAGTGGSGPVGGECGGSGRSRSAGSGSPRKRCHSRRPASSTSTAAALSVIANSTLP